MKREQHRHHWKKGSVPTRTKTCLFASPGRIVPVFSSSRSLNVLLPWSMCATMQKLRYRSMGMAAMRFSSSAGVGFVAYDRVHRALHWERIEISFLTLEQSKAARRSGPSHVVLHRGQARPALRATLIKVTVVVDCALATEPWDKRLLPRRICDGLEQCRLIICEAKEATGVFAVYCYMGRQRVLKILPHASAVSAPGESSLGQ